MLTIICGDALEKLRELPDESVHCCVTSPPYWDLRDYGTASWEGGDDDCDHISGLDRPRSDRPLGAFHGGDDKFHTTPFKSDCRKCGAKRIDAQFGLEKTPEEYVAKMVEVFREVRRVLRKDGTCWINLGDSYNANQGAGFDTNQDGGLRKASAASPRIKWGKPKDLVGIPWMIAFALRADGWYLRQDIIWAKPNPMPESVTDRCTKSHEYLFLLTKSARYFYDSEAVREQHQDAKGIDRFANSGGCAADFKAGENQGWTGNGFLMQPGQREYNPAGRNKRSVWTVATAPYPEAHFATYPPDLIKPCILAGTSAKGCCAKCSAPWERIVELGSTIPLGHATSRKAQNVIREYRGESSLASSGMASNETREKKTIGWQPTCKCVEVGHNSFASPKLIPCTVLDCFAGSGTTGMVALGLGRKAILIELNPKYIPLIESRCHVTPGLALA